MTNKIWSNGHLDAIYSMAYLDPVEPNLTCLGQIERNSIKPQTNLSKIGQTHLLEAIDMLK